MMQYNYDNSTKVADIIYVIIMIFVGLVVLTPIIYTITNREDFTDIKTLVYNLQTYAYASADTVEDYSNPIKKKPNVNTYETDVIKHIDNNITSNEVIEAINTIELEKTINEAINEAITKSSNSNKSNNPSKVIVKENILLDSLQWILLILEFLGLILERKNRKITENKLLDLTK